MKCERNCPGTIEDGYCDTCGMAPLAGSSGATSGGTGSSGGAAQVTQLRLTLVPEPSTLLLLGIGAISLVGYRKAKS